MCFVVLPICYTFSRCQLSFSTMSIFNGIKKVQKTPKKTKFRLVSAFISGQQLTFCEYDDWLLKQFTLGIVVTTQIFFLFVNGILKICWMQISWNLNSFSAENENSINFCYRLVWNVKLVVHFIVSSFDMV